ncbi:MAG: lactate racemase domain-containing protein [Actinomycetes bacterium]
MSSGPFSAVAGMRIGADLPRWLPIRRTGSLPEEADPAGAASHALDPLCARLQPGTRVAVAVGSRGVANLSAVVQAVVARLVEAGAEPYVVPAMGSHGGGTADGQRQVLADLGVSEETVGVPVRATMDTVVVGRTPDGFEVHLDAEAAAADGILVVNRVKAHTDFRSETPEGTFGSGLAKMSVIGLGNHAGASRVHAYGSASLPRHIRAAATVLREAGHLLGGVALIENAADRTARVAAVDADGIGGPAEADLLDDARSRAGALPVDTLDVLVVDMMGKDISGSGMDTNTLGRIWVPGVEEPDRPQVTAVTVHDLTPTSHGNAAGIGLADLVPFRVIDKIDLHATYLNSITSGTGGLRRGRLPMVLATDADVVCAAVRMSGQPDPGQLRLARVRSTRHLDTLMVSEALCADGPPPGYEVRGPAAPVAFTPEGDLPPWPDLG